MKKWLTGSIILVVLMIVAISVFAGTEKREKEKTKPAFECKSMTDQNRDGICDNFSTPDCKHVEGCKSGVIENGEAKKCNGECKQGKEGTKCSGKCRQGTEASKCSGECNNKHEECKAKGDQTQCTSGCPGKKHD
jgi:hypothetical protein